LTIADSNEQYVMDSITLIFPLYSVSLKSQFLNAELHGKYKLTGIATAVSNSLSKYYDRIRFSKKKG
jgi:hypothetical protein